MSTKSNNTARLRRKRSIRNKVSGTAARPRLSVFRSNKHIYAQVIDDVSGRTLAAASDVASKESNGAKIERARVVGAAIAAACKEQGIEQVVFDRNGYVYRSATEENPNSKPTRITALADAAREGGLEF